MVITVRPADVFEDVETIIGPKNPASSVCFCLSYRIPSKEANALRGPDRAARVRRLMDEEGPIGVLAHDDGEVVGWAAVAPRRLTHFATFRKIPHVDEHTSAHAAFSRRRAFRRRPTPIRCSAGFPAC